MHRADAAVAIADKTRSLGRVFGVQQEINEDVLKAWPLTTSDTQHVLTIKSIYSDILTPIPELIFEVDINAGLLHKSYRARNPLTDKDLNLTTPSLGCLHNEVASMSIALRNYKLTKIKNKDIKQRHLCTSLMVHEFHNFVNHIATFARPTDECLEAVNARSNLIKALMHKTDTNMKGFADWLALMDKIKIQLDRITEMWPVLTAQQMIQEHLHTLKTQLTSTLIMLLTYQYYVVKIESGEFDFDPTFPMNDDAPVTMREKILRWIMLEENVVVGCGQRIDDRAERRLMLMDTKSQQNPSSDFTQILNIDADKARKNLAPIFLEKSGLPAEKLMAEIDMDGDERGEAIELWFGLHKEAVGLARGQRLMEHAHTLSGLGGDLLMSKETSKDLAVASFEFVGNRLTGITKKIQRLNFLLDSKYSAGKLKNSKRKLHTNHAFCDWEKNFSYAQDHCCKGILSNAKEMLKSLDLLSTCVRNLNVAEIERKISNAGNEFVSLSFESFKLFDQECTVPTAVTMLPAKKEIVDAEPPKEVALVRAESPPRSGKEGWAVVQERFAAPKEAPPEIAPDTQGSAEEILSRRTAKLSTIDSFIHKDSWTPARPASSTMDSTGSGSQDLASFSQQKNFTGLRNSIRKRTGYAKEAPPSTQATVPEESEVDMITASCPLPSRS